MVEAIKMDDELSYGRYSKQIDYRGGKVSQVLEHKTETMIPISPTNLELVVETLKTLLYEASTNGYKTVGVEVEFKNKKLIKVIRKNITKKAG